MRDDDDDDDTIALDTAQAAAFLTGLGVTTSKQKLDKQRTHGGGPVYSKLGRGSGQSGRVRYTKANLRKHAREVLAAGARRNTSEAA